MIILLRKIALPYPHKCLFGFVEQNVSTDKNFLRNILVTSGDPFVCACPRLRSSCCRQTIVESSSLYFWSIWEQHVFSFIIVHLQTKIYEVLKRASVHLAVVVHYWTGTTTNSTSLVLKKVTIKMFLYKRSCCEVFSGRRCTAALTFYSTGTTCLSRKGLREEFAVKFPVGNKEERI